MSELSPIPLIDPSVIRQTLDRIRQAEPLGDNPLKRLVWLRQRLDQYGALPSAVALDIELSEALSALIVANRSRLRQVVGASLEEASDRQAALDILRDDYAHSNTELEAWSALYFRYVRIDLDLRAQEMAQVVGVDPRQLRRRFEHAYQRVAEAISRAEIEARRANQRLWMRLKLPPAPYSRLFGVDSTLDRAYEMLLDGQPPHGLALVGPGGIGKTALAHALTARLIDEGGFDDLAWVSLTTSATYVALCSLIAREVGLLHLVEEPLADLEAGLRIRLASVATLIVIDGADWLADLETLLPRLSSLAEPGRLLVIVRGLPAGTPTRALPIGSLPRPIMDDLLLDFARLRRAPQPERSLTPEALAAIYQAVGGNPLAGRLIVGQLVYLPLERALARLGAIPTRGDESLFQRLFEDAWTSAGDAAQRAAMALLILPAEGGLWSDIQAICGLKPDNLDPALEALVMSSLVRLEGEEPRYVLSPLARSFVEDQSRLEPWRDTLRHMLEEADQRLTAEYELPTAGGFTQMMSLLHQEAGLGELPDNLEQRIARVAPSARRSGQWLAWRDLLRYIVERLEPTHQNPHGLARALAELGAAYRWLGESDLARTTLEEAVALFGEVGDFIGQAEVLLEIGLLHQSMGQRDESRTAYERAAAVSQRYESPGLQRRALNGLAGLALDDSHPEEALKLLQASLAASDDPPDAQTLSNLGMVMLELGDPARAIHYEQQALASFSDEGDLPREARTHLRLGRAYHAAHQPDEALRQLTEGLGLMRAMGDALGQAHALNNLGAVYSADQRFEEALAVWRDALALQDQLGDRVGMAYMHFNLADLLWKLGQSDRAQAALRESSALADALNLPSLAAHIAAHPLNQSAGQNQPRQ